MDIRRIDGYTDSRFPREVLNQHGAFLVDGAPWSFRVVSDHEAVVSGEGLTPETLAEAAENFRFYAGHITTFYDGAGKPLLHLPPWRDGRRILTASSPPSSPWTGRNAKRWGVSSAPPPIL